MCYFYTPIAEHITTARKVPKGSMNADEYVRGVLSNALRAKPKPSYGRGESARLVWFMTTYQPLQCGQWIRCWQVLKSQIR